MRRYLDDVRRYDKRAEPEVVMGLARYLGGSLRAPDARYVATSNRRELDAIRDKFLKRKLGLKARRAALDEILDGVAEEMKAQRMKRRLTFYYLVAKKADKLGMFNGKSRG